MFEKSLIDVLKADSELIALISTFKDSPSIFSHSAPENTEFPYIVFDIYMDDNIDSVVDKFEIFFNFFDHSNSAARARKVSRRLIELLDRQTLEDDYYNYIRFFRTSIDIVKENDEDPRKVHYITRFMARAGREGWIKNYTGV